MMELFSKILRKIIWILKIPRNIILSLRYGISPSKHVYFGKNVRIVNPQHVDMGGQVFIDDDVELCVNQTMPGVTPKLLIGNRVHFGKMNRIGCDNRIIIEDDVLFAPHVHISDRNHGFEDIHTPISQQKVISKGEVVIGTETWLGFGCQVMSGVKIGRHCVIAAGAIVVKDVPDYCVVGGNPAKILKKFNQINNKWEKYDD